MLKSTQYKKKLAPNALWFTKNLANHMNKKWNKEHQTLSFQLLTNKISILMFFVSFFMWFARFQILFCEPQSIRRKLLLLSWLNWEICYMIEIIISGDGNEKKKLMNRWKCIWERNCFKKMHSSHFQDWVWNVMNWTSYLAKGNNTSLCDSQ